MDGEKLALIPYVAISTIYGVAWFAVAGAVAGQLNKS
jgi:hypothetical protein